MKPRLLLIDNYDSFTYNLVQAFLVLGAGVDVYRNDEISVGDALKLDPTHLCISPGPGRPEDAGVSLDMIAAFETKVPILGVCLGHQSLVSHFGGRIVSAERLMHGKTSMIHHDGKGVYRGLSEPFEAGRYHSLAAEHQSLPSVLEISATILCGCGKAFQPYPNLKALSALPTPSAFPSRSYMLHLLLTYSKPPS